MTRRFFLSVCSLLFVIAAHAQGNAEYAQWINKANTFYQAKQYKESTDAFTHAFAALGGKGYPDDRYNAACAWSLAGNNDSAFFQLERIATKTNYADYNHLIIDADLNNMHSDKRWQPLCDLVKQNKEKSEANLNKPLVAILDTVMQDDQTYRMRIDGIAAKYGQNSKEMTELWKTIRYYDSVDLIKVTSIIDKYGWPGPDVVGQQGNSAVFLVIQHADIVTQDKYLPLMRDAVKNNKARPSDLALLEDRTALRHGGKQIYGSQVQGGPNGNSLSPLEDPDNVDKRRAEVGLGTLADYLAQFGVKWDLAEYKKQHPETQKK